MSRHDGIRRTLMALVAMVAAIALIPLATASAQEPADDGETFDRWIVETAPELRVAPTDGAQLGDGYEVVETSEELTIEEAEAVFADDPSIVSFTPDYLMHAATLPDDPLFLDHQWGLYNQTNTGIDIGALDAWTVTTGSSDVVVAVIDSGIEIEHEDLQGNIWVNPDEVADGKDTSGNGYIDDIHGWDFIADSGTMIDDNGHGTHVAGTIGAEGDNGIGVTGVNWDTQLMGLRFLNADGVGYTSHAVEAIRYAVDNGADIINASFSGPSTPTLQRAVDYATDNGVLFVAAAGNDSNDNSVEPVYPGAYEDVISVAAFDENGDLAEFSNYGAETVDFGAPGVFIASTYLDDSYVYMNGTSMASPHVAGIAALMLSADPSLSPAEVRGILQDTTTPLASLEGKTMTGGMVRADAALQAVTAVSAAA